MHRTELGVFGKIAVARQAIRERAEEIVELLINNAKMAQARGQHDVADKTYKWLLEHMPADEGEQRVISPSVDKQEQVVVQKDAGPRIQIGIQVGGTTNKRLPAATAQVIDVKPESA